MQNNFTVHQGIGVQKADTTCLFFLHPQAV